MKLISVYVDYEHLDLSFVLFHCIYSMYEAVTYSNKRSQSPNNNCFSSLFVFFNSFFIFLYNDDHSVQNSQGSCNEVQKNLHAL